MPNAYKVNKCPECKCDRIDVIWHKIRGFAPWYYLRCRGCGFFSGGRCSPYAAIVHWNKMKKS